MQTVQGLNCRIPLRVLAKALQAVLEWYYAPNRVAMNTGPDSEDEGEEVVGVGTGSGTMPKSRTGFSATFRNFCTILR